MEQKTRLIYGTYRRKEWEKIVELFHDMEVPYRQSVRYHAFQTWSGDEDVWTFHQLEAEVDRETEKEIRRRRDLLKKRYI